LRRPLELGQYTSLRFGRRLREAGIAQSMGSRGDALDNAMCESFFASLETELLDRSAFATRERARMALFDWIEGFYNPHRLHAALGYLSPAEFERRRTAASGKAITPTPSAEGRRSPLSASSDGDAAAEAHKISPNGLAA
jgi:integrase-like protein